MARTIRATEHALSMAFTLGAIFGLTASLTHPARWQVALVVCALLAVMLYDVVQLRRHQESSF